MCQKLPRRIWEKYSICKNSAYLFTGNGFLRRFSGDFPLNRKKLPQKRACVRKPDAEGGAAGRRGAGKQKKNDGGSLTKRKRHCGACVNRANDGKPRRKSLAGLKKRVFKAPRRLAICRRQGYNCDMKRITERRFSDGRQEQ